MAWAKEQARIETEKYKQQNQAKTVLIPFHADRLLNYHQQKLFKGGYLFPQAVYYQLGFDRICRKIRAKHHVYRALDVLADECDMIQAEVYKNSNFVTKRMDGILYYDCTNYYFEIEQAESDKQYGKSKDISDGLMGEVEFFSHTKTASTTVTVLEKLTCITIPIHGNRMYLDSNLAFTRIAAAALADKLLQRSGNVVENTLYTAQTRLCRYIFDAASGHHFRDVMTDVAYSIGISYRHLYRMMGQLCRENILEKDTSGYRICDLEKLQELGQRQ